MCLMTSPSCGRVRHWSCPEPSTTTAPPPPPRRFREAEDLLPTRRRLAPWEECVLRQRQGREGRRKARVELALTSLPKTVTPAAKETNSSDRIRQIASRVPETCPVPPIMLETSAGRHALEAGFNGKLCFLIFYIFLFLFLFLIQRKLYIMFGEYLKY